MNDILFADDELVIRKAIKALLESEGFGVRLAPDGDEALRQYEAKRPDVLLLDVMMPKKNGFVVCERIRERDGVTPIIFLTSDPSEVSLVRAFGYGADDFIAKSAPSSELVLRIRAALRRADAVRELRSPNGSIAIGEEKVDLLSAQVKHPDGSTEELTRWEVTILNELQAHRGEYVGIERLFDILHGEDFIGDVALTRKCIYRLRRKLGKSAELLVNKRDCGYLLLCSDTVT